IRHIKKTFNLKKNTVIFLHFKFIASMVIGVTFSTQDGSLDYEYQNNHYSLRLSTLPVRSSESLTIRILPQTKRYTLNELCLFPFQTKEISKLLNFTSGLIVFSGSTGSGKTTL